MRVGVDVRMLKCSGIGKVIENILSRMIKMKIEWAFYLIGKKNEMEEFSWHENKNVHIIECDCPIYTIKEQFVMPIKIPRDLDVFWSPHYNIPIFYKGRLVVTIHDLAHLALPEFSKSYIKKIYAKMMFNIAVKKASNIICVSKFTQKELIKYIRNVKKDKLSVIYNGVDEKWRNIPQKDRVHSKPYFLYVGNIKPHKNLRRLIEAYKMIVNDINEDLILIGKKDGFITGDNNIADAIRGYEKRIIFTGYVSDELLMQYVANAEALVFPSIYEGFGLPPVEALVAGKRVIASKAASIPEVCGEYALYFDPYNVKDIKKQLTIERKPKRMEKEFFCKYDWGKKAEEYIKIFEKVV